MGFQGTWSDGKTALTVVTRDDGTFQGSLSLNGTAYNISSGGWHVFPNNVGTYNITADGGAIKIAATGLIVGAQYGQTPSTISIAGSVADSTSPTLSAFTAFLAKQ